MRAQLRRRRPLHAQRLRHAGARAAAAARAQPRHWCNAITLSQSMYISIINVAKQLEDSCRTCLRRGHLLVQVEVFVRVRRVGGQQLVVQLAQRRRRHLEHLPAHKHL